MLDSISGGVGSSFCDQIMAAGGRDILESAFRGDRDGGNGSGGVRGATVAIGMFVPGQQMMLLEV